MGSSCCRRALAQIEPDETAGALTSNRMSDTATAPDRDLCPRFDPMSTSRPLYVAGNSGSVDSRETTMETVPVMTSHAFSLRVTAPVSVECGFSAQDDGWIGVAEKWDVTVQGFSFAKAKKNMESALAKRIETLLTCSGEASPKSAA